MKHASQDPYNEQTYLPPKLSPYPIICSKQVQWKLVHTDAGNLKTLASGPSFQSDTTSKFQYSLFNTGISEFWPGSQTKPDTKP